MFRQTTQMRCCSVFLFLLAMLSTFFITPKLFQYQVSSSQRPRTPGTYHITGGDNNDVICHVNVSTNQRVQRRQLVRQMTLHKACEREDRERPVTETLQHIYVDEKHQTLYCTIPKVGCSNWKKMLIQLITDNFNLTHIDHDEQLEKAGLIKLHKYPANMRKFMLQNFYKFMFVRDPYERFLSAYKDKFARKNSSFNYAIGRKIIAEYRQHPSKASLKYGHDVTLGEFVKYVTDSHDAELELNCHWRTFLDQCNPCKIHWDFIGKMETIGEDSTYVLSHILGDPCPPTLGENRGGHKTNIELMKNAYKDVPKEDLIKLAAVYQDDVELFGYRDFWQSMKYRNK